MKNLIIVVAAAVFGPLLTPVVYAAAPQTAHYVELPEIVPLAMLRFSGWLVDEGVLYQARVVESPQFGDLFLEGDEVYIPGPDFPQAGLDHFVVELKYADGSGQRVVEQHWIGIRRAELVEVTRWTEDFESIGSEKPGGWDQLGDPTLLKFSDDAPLEGERSCEVLLQHESPSYLRFYPESQPGANSTTYYHGVELPPPDTDDPVGGTVVALSNGEALGVRIEVRVVGEQWKARASADPFVAGMPRPTTAWVTVPHQQAIRFGLESAPELIGTPAAGDFLGFYVLADNMQIHADWLFGTRSAGSVLDVGVLDIDGGQSGAVKFDTLSLSSAVVSTRVPTQEGFEAGQWSDAWTERPGPMTVTGGSSISGTQDLAIELDPELQEQAWLLDPTPDQATAVASSFMLDVDDLDLGAREGLQLWSLHEDAMDGSPWLAQVQVIGRFDGTARLRLMVRDDASVRHSSGWQPVIGTHRITVDWSASDGTGGAVLWIDGASFPVGGSLFNASRLAEAVRIGAWGVNLQHPRDKPSTLRFDSVLNLY